MLNLKVEKVYVGADRGCRCGCKGKYHEAGSVGATRALNILKQQHSMFPFECSESFGDTVHVNYSYGNNRAITAYFAAPIVALMARAYDPDVQFD